MSIAMLESNYGHHRPAHQRAIDELMTSGKFGRDDDGTEREWIDPTDSFRQKHPEQTAINQHVA